MADRKGKATNAPLKFEFVSGRAKDSSTKSKIRSHAMSAFRSQQRHEQLQLTHIASGPSGSNSSAAFGICQCPPSTQVKKSISVPRRLPPFISSADRCEYCRSMIYPLRLEIYHTPSPEVSAFGNFDPFGGMAGIAPELMAKYFEQYVYIKDYAINFCSFKSKPLPEALRSPALLSSILFMVYVHLCAISPSNVHLGLALTLKANALEHINRRLAKSDTMYSINTLASIAYFSMANWAFGNIADEIATHTVTMVLVVKSSDMQSLGNYPFGQTVHKFLAMHHIMANAIQVQEPNIAVNSFTKPPIIYLDSPIYYSSDSFEHIRQLQSCSDQTCNLLYIGRDINNLILENHETHIDVQTFNWRLLTLKTQLENETYVRSTSGIQNDWIFESCRLAILVTMQAVETCKPLSSTDESLTQALVQALEKTNTADKWEDMLGSLYWVCMIGAAASEGRAGHKILASTLGRTMFQMAFGMDDFDCAVKPIQRFAAMQIALNRRFEVAISVEVEREINGAGSSSGFA